MLKKLLLGAFTAAAIVGIASGCDRNDGAGDAIEEAGENIQDAADDTADELNTP